MTHGLFEWVDLSVPDLEAAAGFYGDLFGWESERTEEGVEYMVCRRDGHLAAGMVRTDSGSHQWNSYVTVDSVDAIAEQAASLGATVAAGPVDVGVAGRMVYIVDPMGAGLGFWEPGEHQGAESFNKPGFLTWNELRTNDPDAARQFYGALLPEWSFEEAEVPEGFYTMVELGDRLNGAVAPLGDRFAEMGSHWAVWFTVDDAASDAERIEDIGGSALGEVVATSYGPAVRLADPFGSPFLVIGPMAAPG